MKSTVVDGGTVRYNVDITNLNWESYVKQYVLGIRKYVLKDSPDTLNKARSKLNK
jgi:fatty acyl-CoA reductase